MIRAALALVMCLGLGLGLSQAKSVSMWEKLVQKSDSERVPGRYIVALQPGFDAEAFVTKLKATNNNTYRNCSFHHFYKHALNGFSARLTSEALLEVLAMDEVMLVEEDGVMKADAVPGSWGLDRVDQRFLPLDGQAVFTGDGTDVTAYIIDTGIYPPNIYFDNRAAVGYDAIGGGEYGIDCAGHGTHCAGTIGAGTYGIATGAQLVGVRVLNCLGSGTTSQVVAGVDWVTGNADKPAVASMSLGGGGSTSLDNAVRGLISSGVLVSVSGGNEDRDACNNSPARVSEAVTAGATDREDVRASFSNYGVCVDIFAPGVDITSTWIGSESATSTISGTSMSCPHVSGAAVIALGNDNNLSPAALKERLLDDATPDVVEDPGEGSPNLMLYIP